jgi:hypothetical protein
MNDQWSGKTLAMFLRRNLAGATRSSTHSAVFVTGAGVRLLRERGVALELLLIYPRSQ